MSKCYYSGDGMDEGRTAREDRASQLLLCEMLSLAKTPDGCSAKSGMVGLDGYLFVG